MDLEDVLSFIQHVDRMKNPIQKYPGKTVVHVFCDRSRSLYSFQAAALHLGCNIITIDHSMNETLEDIVRTVQHYGDVMVLKHSENNAYTRAVSVSKIPVIQCGINGEMIQPLTDLYTLYKELKYRGIQIESTDRPLLKVIFLGYNRNVQPLVSLLNVFPRIEFIYIQDMKNLDYTSDVLYVSTPQSDEDYCIHKQVLNNMKPALILMHPLPRKLEILEEVDTNPRSAYFQQSENSMYVKMVFLDKLLAVRTAPTICEHLWFLWGKLRSYLPFVQ